MISCDFGNVDLEYELNGEKFTLPAGTAHFLEHKMFESSDGSDMFLEFDNFGGNANAFTSFENTGYYFSCTDNFFENLDILLKSVSSIHFTDESIEKEKKIIAREIMMYEDSPHSAMTRNLYKSLYHRHPLVTSISGTVESISHIGKEILTRAYNDFYVPSNMSLCVCGDVDAERVKELAEKYFGTPSHPRPKTLFDSEPIAVKNNHACASLPVAVPLFALGIKCEPFEKIDLDAQRRGTAMRLAVSLTFGRSSDFYCDNYEKGLLNERFFASYTQSKNASHLMISGSGADYKKIAELAVKEIEKRKKEFFSDEQILREKRASYAECIMLFDNGEDIVSAIVPTAFLGFDEFDCIELVRDITPDEIRDALNSIDTENFALSVITPRI
jgi:predicted Zn-dependent peptidase